MSEEKTENSFITPLRFEYVCSSFNSWNIQYISVFKYKSSFLKLSELITRKTISKFIKYLHSIRRIVLWNQTPSNN